MILTFLEPFLTTKELNLAYDGFAYFGKINFTESNLDFINERIIRNADPELVAETLIQPNDFSYYGGGLSGEIDFNIPIGSLDWRIIGVKATIIYEGGDYFDFREELVDKAAAYWVADGALSDDTFLFSESPPRNLNGSNVSIDLSFNSSIVIALKNAEIGIVSSMSLGIPRFSASSSLYFLRKRTTFFISAHGSLQGDIIRTGIAYRIR